jgi:hypothetical protein
VSTVFVKSSPKFYAMERNGSVYPIIMTTTTAKTTTDPSSQPRRYCDKRLVI